MEKKTRHEYLDPTPMAIPVKYQRPSTEQARVRALVQGILSAQAEEQGFESWEEANDFDIGDDYDPHSPWEYSIDDERAHWEAYNMAQQQIDPATGKLRDEGQTDGGQVGNAVQSGSNVDPTPGPNGGDRQSS